MTVESAWTDHPDYRIDIEPCPLLAEVWAGDVLLARSERCLVLREQRLVDRLYVPEDDVRWELFEPSAHRTVCRFKGEARYWNLVGAESQLGDVVWAYPEPFAEVGAIEGFVCFYQDRVSVLLHDRWPDGTVVPTRFPVWGDASELLRLIDVEPAGPGHFLGPAYGDTPRNVVEGGQLLAEAIVAAAKTVPGQRVVSASMVFLKAASFDAPLDVDVEVLRAGRTFSTVEVRIGQDGTLRSAGIVLLDAGADDVIRDAVEMPNVPGPDEAVPYPDFAVTGRDLRVIDAAYSPDPDEVGPPVIDVWARFRDAPADRHLHAALLAQSTTHWTIGAALRPHPGFGEADAHVTLSTGIMQTTIDFHDEVDVTEWLLYTNRAIWSGAGRASGEGRVFTRDGRLAASYSVQAMIRSFERDPAAMGRDHRTAM